MPLLRFIDASGSLRTLPLGTQPVTIGREATCSVVFNDEMVSREHSRIDPEANGRFRIRDLGSRNKTHVNGQQVTETLLGSGDVVRVGDHVIEFLDADAAREKLSTEFFTPDTQEPADCAWMKTKAPITLSLAQLEQLALLSANCGVTSRPEDIADRCLSQITLDLQAERGFIAVRGDDKQSVRVIAHRGLARSPGGALTPVSQTFALAPLLQKVAGCYPQAARGIEAKSGYAATAVAAPLTFKTTPIGVIYADRPQSKTVLPGAALQYVAAAGAIIGASMALASRRLAATVGLQETVALSALQHTHQALGSAPTGNDTFDVAWRLFPGSLAHGDFGEVVHLDEHRSLAVLIDAGGQGFTGLAQAAAIRGALVTSATAHPDDFDLAAVLNALNALLARPAGRQLVGVAALLCDLAAGRLAYINAGLPPPVILAGPGRLITLDQPSLLLGIDANYGYEVTAVDLPARFRVVAYTHGLIDAANAANETFGDHRAHDALLDKDAFAPAADIVKRMGEMLISHVAGATFSDDAAILVMGRG